MQLTTLAVGAPNEGIFKSGAVYVFERNGASWNEVQKLIASDAQADEGLGRALSMDENYILAGAPARSGGRGAVMVFQRIGGVWSENEVFQIDIPQASADEHFGGSVALSGMFALIGSSGVNAGRGVSYLYERSGSTWLQQTRIEPMDEGGADGFGGAVALQGEHAVVGARGDDNGNGAGAGAAYLVSLSGSVSIVAVEPLPSAGQAFHLQQNYPNPFGSITTIPIQVATPAHVRLDVYDVLGRRVARLIDEYKATGVHEVAFKRGQLASGIYFARVTDGSEVQFMKMILVD